MKVLPILLSLTLLGTAQMPGQAAWRDLALEAHRAQKQNDNGKAIEMWTKALAEAEKLGPDHPWLSVSLRNLGILYFNSKEPGSIDKSREYFTRERSALKRLGDDYPDQALGLQYRARIDAIQGQYPSSAENYSNALKLSEKYGTPQPQLLLEIEVPLIMTKREDEAAKCRERLRDIVAHAYPEPARQAAEFINLCEKLEEDAARAEGNFSKPYYRVSILLLTDALKLVPGIGNEEELRQRGLVLLKRSQSYRKQSSYRDACIDARNAISVLQKIAARDLLVTALRETAFDICALGKPSEAIGLQTRAINRYEELTTKPEVTLAELKKELDYYTNAAAQKKSVF